MTTQQQPAVYVPPPGEVVLKLGDVVSYEWRGENVGTVIASPEWRAAPGGGAYDIDGYVWVSHPGRPGGVCKRAGDVRPLRSAIDVECPHVSDWKSHGFRSQCGGVVGKLCTNVLTEQPIVIGCHHGVRGHHFRSLTGQAPKDSRSGHDVEQRPEPGRPPAIVGSERGDSGTGRAAGVGNREARPKDPPAVPSGFQKCRIEKCDQEARHAGYCADCAGEIDPRDDFRALQRGRGKGILRTELDRPLPKPAALRTWPEHWETPGWES